MLAVVNKVDGREQEWLAPEFHSLGLELLPVSAAHGYNISSLVERLIDFAPPPEEASELELELELGETNDEASEEELTEDAGAELADFPPDADAGAREIPEEAEEAARPAERPAVYTQRGLRVAMLGRPNVGKSSIVNAILGQRRMIVSEIAGTTVDSVDVALETPEGKRFTFVDTAGVRRRTKITDAVEKVSVQASLKSQIRADVTVVVLDAVEGFTSQDKRLVARLERDKAAYVIVVNKLDLVPSKERNKARREWEHALKICPYAPRLFVSALEGKARGVEQLLPAAEELWEESGRRVGTGVLNRAMQEALQRCQPPVVKRIRAKFYYMTQAGTRPTTLVLFVNDPERVKESYLRYLEGQFRKRLGYPHAPLRLVLKRAHEKRGENRR